MGKSQLSAAKLEKSLITFENQYKIAVDVILRQRGKAIEINSLRWLKILNAVPTLKKTRAYASLK